jgi:predicted DNA-binding transcriptional regulator AlpA
MSDNLLNIGILNIAYIRLDRWCDYTGISRQSMYNDISDGKLLRGTHYIKVGNRILLNLKEVNLWLEKQQV